MNQGVKIIVLGFQNKPDEKAAAIEAFKGKIADNFGGIDTHLSSNKFICGDKPTWCDFYLYGVVDMISQWFDDVPKECKNLKKSQDALCAKESLANYLKKLAEKQ